MLATNSYNFFMSPDLKAHFNEQPSLFDQCMLLNGICFRKQPGRCTQQVFLNNKPYFIKQHTGVGWKEIFKNLLQLKIPVISAKNEWLAIQRCEQLGINTPVIAAYGARGFNPAYRYSFLLTEALIKTRSLEELAHEWKQRPPTVHLKRCLIAEVARISRLLHLHGINHRDFYLCHFLFDEALYQQTGEIKLYLIDLHRAQIRKKTPLRWINKDLIGLYFSCKDVKLTMRDLYRFIRDYRQQPLRHVLAKEASYWMHIIRRGDKLYRDHEH